MSICQTCKQEIKTDRSTLQNNYWWKCMSILGEHLGYDNEEMSIVLKDHFGWYEEFQANGETKRKYDSSAKWNKQLFSARTEMLLRFASQNDCYIMTPDEYFNQYKK